MYLKLIKYYNYIDWNDDNLIEKYIIKNNDVIYYIMIDILWWIWLIF